MATPSAVLTAYDEAVTAAAEAHRRHGREVGDETRFELFNVTTLAATLPSPVQICWYQPNDAVKTKLKGGTVALAVRGARLAIAPALEGRAPRLEVLYALHEVGHLVDWCVGEELETEIAAWRVVFERAPDWEADRATYVADYLRRNHEAYLGGVVAAAKLDRLLRAIEDPRNRRERSPGAIAQFRTQIFALQTGQAECRLQTPFCSGAATQYRLSIASCDRCAESLDVDDRFETLRAEARRTRAG